jgi:hypothetical protein
MKANQEELNACQEETVTKMKACLGVAEACPGKMQAKIKADNRKMRTEIKTGMEGIEATESTNNEEKIQAIAEPFKLAQCVKAIHMLTDL